MLALSCLAHGIPRQILYVLHHLTPSSAATTDNQRGRALQVVDEYAGNNRYFTVQDKAEKTVREAASQGANIVLLQVRCSPCASFILV